MLISMTMFVYLLLCLLPFVCCAVLQDEVSDAERRDESRMNSSTHQFYRNKNILDNSDLRGGSVMNHPVNPSASGAGSVMNHSVNPSASGGGSVMNHSVNPSASGGSINITKHSVVSRKFEKFIKNVIHPRQLILFTNKAIERANLQKYGNQKKKRFSIEQSYYSVFNNNKTMKRYNVSNEMKLNSSLSKRTSVHNGSSKFLLEKRECCHYYDHGHDLMEMHNNPHHYGEDFLHGGAHDEFHSIDEHGDRTDFGDGPEPSYFMSNHHGGGGFEGGGGYGDGGGVGFGGEVNHIHEEPHYHNYQPHEHYTDVHNEPHFHNQNFYHEPHYHQHFHHYVPHFEHNDYHYVDDHHEHYHNQPHYVNNEVHIHHDIDHHSEPSSEYHHGSGDSYHQGRFHHVKVNLHGPGKSPSQWSHQEEEEGEDMSDHYGGEDDLNNYDTGAGFFQLNENGGEVDITSLHKSGTKVHMGGGQFSVIRDPWRFHSAFAGLFHPHETMGAGIGGGGGGMGGFGGGGGVQQFHQHFTYINNERNEKTKVQNLVHHEHEGEAAHTEHHYSEHHDDHHLHHEHEHRGHHDDHHDANPNSPDLHSDHERHHHHHEEDEDHHHYEEHHADSVHGHGGDGGYGGGGGYGAGPAIRGGGDYAFARRDVDSYKIWPGSLTNGEEQAHGTPIGDNYRSDRVPSVLADKRNVNQITPHTAPLAMGGSGDITGSKRTDLVKTAGDKNDTIEELTIDDDIKDDLTLEENKDIVKKVYFNNLIHHHHGEDAEDDDDYDKKEKEDGVDGDNKNVDQGSSSGESSGLEEAAKRKVGKGDGKEEISGFGPLNTHLRGPEAGITNVFIGPMVVRRNIINRNTPDNGKGQRRSYFETSELGNSNISDKHSSSPDLQNSLLRKIDLFKRKFLSSMAH